METGNGRESAALQDMRIARAPHPWNWKWGIVPRGPSIEPLLANITKVLPCHDGSTAFKRASAAAADLAALQTLKLLAVCWVGPAVTLARAAERSFEGNLRAVAWMSTAFPRRHQTKRLAVPCEQPGLRCLRWEVGSLLIRSPLKRSLLLLLHLDVQVCYVPQSCSICLSLALHWCSHLPATCPRLDSPSHPQMGRPLVRSTFEAGSLDNHLGQFASGLCEHIEHCLSRNHAAEML